MKKTTVIVMLLVTFSQVLFSETFEIVVNKDTNFIDNMGEDIGKVSQGTVLTVNTENDEICHYFEDREGKDASLYLSELDKCIYMRDITVKNASDSLPEDIIGSVYTMSYYLKDILNDSTDNLFLNEPYLTEFWNEKDVVEGENFSEGYSPFSIKFYSNIFFKNYNTFTLYSWTPFFIENIKKENDGFYLKLFLLTPRNGYSPIFERINRPRKKGLYLKFQIDGDYLLVYKDGTLIFEFIKANKNMLAEIRSFYVNHEVDFSRITFPRHADGTCDYDDKIIKNHKVGGMYKTEDSLRLRAAEGITGDALATLAAGSRVKVLAPGREDTIDGIKSNWVQVEVLGGAKDKDGNAIEAGTKGWLFGGYLSTTEYVDPAKEEKKNNLLDSVETKDERKMNRAVKMNKKEEKDDFVFPFIQVGFGIILTIVLLPIILVIAKKRKSGKE